MRPERTRTPSKRYLASVDSEIMYKRAKQQLDNVNASDSAGSGTTKGLNAASGSSDQSDAEDSEASEDDWRQTNSGDDDADENQESDDSGYDTPSPPEKPTPTRIKPSAAKGMPLSSDSRSKSHKTQRNGAKKEKDTAGAGTGTPRAKPHVWTPEEDRVFWQIHLDLRMPWNEIDEKLRAIQAKRGGPIKTRQDICNHYRFIRKRIETIAGPAPKD